MSPYDFRDYILRFIFYKYLSEKIERYADQQLAQENLTFKNLNEKNQKDQAYIEVVKDASLSELGYFLKPFDLFSQIVKRGSNQNDSENIGQKHNFILDDLTRILKSIEQSTLGTDSEDDFENLFEDLDLTSTN